MALPRMTKEEKRRVVEALQAANHEGRYPGFDNHADRYGPFVVTGYWTPEMEEFPGYRVIGPGPVVVDTRDFSVEFHGSTPQLWPAWFTDGSLERGRVKLADAPIPGNPCGTLTE